MSVIKLSNKLFSLGLDPREMSVYAYLCSLPATASTLSGAAVVKVRQQTIAERCLIRSAKTVSGILSRLAEKELVEVIERDDKPQRRGTHVYAVRRLSVQGGWFFVDRRIFGQLVPRQMTVYLFLCKAYNHVLSDSWNSYTDIARQTGMKREVVIQTISELVAGHHIVKYRKRSADNKRVFVDNHYAIVRYTRVHIRHRPRRIKGGHPSFRPRMASIRMLAAPYNCHPHYTISRRSCQVLFWCRGSPNFTPHFKYPRSL